MHSLRSENVANDSKNKETPASLFFCRKLAAPRQNSNKFEFALGLLNFSRRQRSKVIFLVTQKSLRILLNYSRNHLALAGGSAPYSLLPMVAHLLELWSNPSFHLPMVAFILACPSVGVHSDFHNSKNECYGK